MPPGVMPKNSPALLKRLFRLVFFAALLAQAGVIYTDEPRWYRSNASGMALEFVPSRLAAMRNEFCLSLEIIPDGDVQRILPGLLLPHYDTSYRVELRILYEKGEEIRRQWIFRDQRNTGRLVASGNDGLGFIEIRDIEGFIVREFRFEDDGSQWEYRFSYQEKTLLRAEAWFKAPPLAAGDGEDSDDLQEPVFVLVSTDSYRYTRSGFLRAIERFLHEGAQLSRHHFPRPGPNFASVEGFQVQGIAYSSDFLLDIYIPDAATISYTLDSRGRVLTETWKDDDGEVLGEYRNTWSGDRLHSILWESKDEQRLVEYEYDGDGNRTVERNFRQGILERVVTGRDGREMEEIYMNGRLMLRAFWENGIKISEERIPGQEQPR